MLVIYIAALVIGAGMLLVQAVMGHDADADGDSDGDSDLLFLSPRFWTFLALAFGISGLLLTLFHLASSMVVLAIASGAGVASGAFAALVLRALKRGQVSSGSSEHEAIGRIGEVLVPLEKGRIGKVRVALRGQTLDLMAMGGDQPLALGARVVIEDIEGGIARVSRAPDEIA